jgi:hypothetical protein
VELRSGDRRPGPLPNYKQKFPQAVKNMGAIIANVKAAMQLLGYNIANARDVNPLDDDLTCGVVRVRSGGAQMVVVSSCRGRRWS